MCGYLLPRLLMHSSGSKYSLTTVKDILQDLPKRNNSPSKFEHRLCAKNGRLDQKIATVNLFSTRILIEKNKKCGFHCFICRDEGQSVKLQKLGSQ